jgi:dienelactone hydrolase
MHLGAREDGHRRTDGMAKRSPKKAKTRSAPGLHLSPSEQHRALMDAAPPVLAYDGGDVRAWQRRLRRKLKSLLGYAFPKDRPPLRPRTLWTRDHPLGRIEKIAFASEPKSDVVAYFCAPHDAAPPWRTVVCLQGHSTGMHKSIGVTFDESGPMEVEGDRDFALTAMRNGLAALCIEQRCFGQRAETLQEPRSRETCTDAAMHALMLGRTAIAERVRDVDRGLDYLAARGDVDMRRVGVMGNSGGGTTSVFAAALLPRIAIAMPSCYFCTFRDSIMSVYHCTCNFVPGLLPVAEMADVFGLFAPKPVVVVAGREDELFPIRATRRAVRDLRRIYAAAGAGDRVRFVEGAGGHRFYADQAWPVYLEAMP